VASVVHGAIECTTTLTRRSLASIACIHFLIHRITDSTDMSQHEIISRAREYVLENFLYSRQGYEFLDTDSLLEHGIIDSLGVLELVMFVETEFGVAISGDEITEANLGTLSSIGRFVQRKRLEYLAA
jgi:acyl carrier protein